MRHLLIILACLSGVIFTSGITHAQLGVQLELNRENYLVYEAVKANVTITNRAGRDIVIDGPGGQPWLSFNISSQGGADLSPYTSNGFGIEPVVLKSGTSISKNIILNRRYSLSQRGNYTVRANVYFPPLQRFINTSPRRFNIAEGRIFWERVVGVPEGQGKGGFHRYMLLSYQAPSDSLLYFRLKNEEEDRVYTTYSLGKIIQQRQPQITTDEQNYLHVLFMAAPRTYSYTVIRPDGRVDNREVYREVKGNFPTLVQSEGGSVTINGGVFVDPDAPRTGGQLGLGGGYTPPGGVRRLSERPPGWGNPGAGS